MPNRGLPASTDRPGRARLAGATRLSRRALLRALAVAGVGAATGAAGYGFLYERHHLDVTRTDVPVSGLPDALDGLRLALVTDTHFSSTVPAADIERAVRAALDAVPDIVVLGGDYVTWGDRAYVSGAAELLAPLRAPHGVFAVLGNHDDDRDMPAALTAKGFTVLKDARTRIVVHGEPLDVAGVRFWTRRVDRVAAVLRGATATTILLAHDPSRLREAASLNVPLVLSGHTHGGQIVLPVAGALAARGFPVVSGYGRRENTSIYVSRGVGTVYVPLRLNCPPEVAILTLKRQASF
ncbi:MAG TPA: metallophosphoesterase [Vicinamibacterales bacterium]|nr:metallophosphoesterase [Vicinamibacterales bacterium]